MVIELRVMQFWSEIILVIPNHAYDFRPNLHSTQFNYHYLQNKNALSSVESCLLGDEFC